MSTPRLGTRERHGGPRTSGRRALALGWRLGLLCAASGCSGSGGGAGAGPPVGTLAAKPEDGGLYFEDEHRSGSASRLSLIEISWGRLVDVHAVDEHGAALPTPVLRDFVINENVQTDPDRYALLFSPITQKTRLVVRRELGVPDRGDGFASLVAQAARGLAGVLPKSDHPSESTPFSFVARNAALVLRFDDLLDDDGEAILDLAETVRLQAGYPPSGPTGARRFFDPNHGGTAGGRFHSSRVIVDLTVSESEASDAPAPLVVNSIGLPSSEPVSERPNVVLRLPTRVDPGSGQFALLRSLAGVPLASQRNGPLDAASPTLDLVRALRAGNELDTNNGFLLDLEPPCVVGRWPGRVLGARPHSEERHEWSLDVLFTTVCRKTPARGDVLGVGEFLLEVDQDGGPPDAQGLTRDVRVRVLNAEAPADPGRLLGGASYDSLYFPDPAIRDGCWAQFTPEARTHPEGDVPPEARTRLRFSEAMDPASIRPFDTILHVRGGSTTPPSPANLIVGELQASLDLREVTFVPSAPYAHSGERPIYHLRLPRAGGVTDLSGNELALELPAIEFTIDPLAPPRSNGSLVLRFDSPDELEPFGAADLRGQFTYDFARGAIRPRAMVSGSQVVDRSIPKVAIMPPFLPGVATPLSPFGSKLQMLWRYADLGWSIRDESKYNLDVVGMCWAPARGQVSSDYFERFEMRMAHSVKLPDEQMNATTRMAKYPFSGLFDGPVPFVDNLLVDPLGRQVVVSEGARGYRIDPAELFLAASGTPVIPFPMNRGGGALVSFTWRDTAILARGGVDGRGVPMDSEVGAPLFLEDEVGSFAPVGEVPTVGLPLLVEFRCYPSESGIGLNPLAIHLASGTSAAPNFRAFSTGGFNSAGQRVTKNPDLEPAPSGGFNPGSRPPGRPTRRTSDNTLYLGQLDYVVRISRAHTIWIDSGVSAPRYTGAVIEPAPEAQPPGTEVRVDFRGADGFIGADQRPFQAGNLDAYGEVREATIVYHANDPTWKRTLAEIQGARFFQLRFTFVNNVPAALSPELSGVGIAYSIGE